MSTRVPTKSILKQSTRQKSTDEQRAKKDQDKRNLNIALNHANRIELQKKIELQIVQNIGTLLSLPAVSPPSDQDRRNFTTLIHPFQPSDFSSLVEERRINGTCGYTLCAKPPRVETLGASASWKLKGKGAADFCSTACVRKALYVKCQLSEVPAWEREPGQQAPVVLPKEDRPDVEVGRKGGGKVEVASTTVANGRELAAERGEEATSFKPRQVMTDSVVEKARSQTASAPLPPRPSANGSHGGAIEGYESRFKSKRKGEDDSEDDDDDDDEIANDTRTTGFSSQVRDQDDNEFNEEEEAAWRELQAGLEHLNTRHDR